MKRSKNKENFMHYMGFSMYPTFTPGDILHLRRCKEKDVKIGDILVFKTEEMEKNVVHRVVSIKDGIVTRGDNNSNNDGWILAEKDIIGKAIIVERDSKKRKVVGGRAGLIRANIVRSLRTSEKRVIKIFRPLYRWISRKGILRSIIPINREMRVVSFKKPEGRELQLHLGNWVIARLKPGAKEWNIKKPFRLIINVEKLPKN